MLKSPYFRIIGFAILLLAQGCTIDQDEKNQYDLISDTVAHGAPKGHYSDWPVMEKEQDVEEIFEGCTVTCKMTFESPVIPLEIAKGQTDACSYACIYNNLPDDYPERAEYKEKAMQYYEIADKLGSTLPPPTLN